jgi:hypothetical protein
MYYENPNPSFVSGMGWNAPAYGGVQPSYAAGGAGQGFAPRFASSAASQPSSQGNFGIETNPSLGSAEYANIGAPGLQHLSPGEFSGSLGRTQQPGVGATLGQLDTIFLTELSRSARGLQDIAEQLEGRDQESQRKGYFAATAHVFYVFGLLSSKGILIPSDLPGRTRLEGGGAASACREFGRVLDRVVDKYASRRGIVEELSLLIERGKICYVEITRAIESAGPSSGAGEPEGQQKKKVA